MYEKALNLLALAVVVAGGVDLSRSLSAQPAEPQRNIWRGTNADTTLIIEEVTISSGRDPLLSGVAVVAGISNRLAGCVFHYRDGIFRAQYTLAGKLQALEIRLLRSDPASVVGFWNGREVWFFRQ